MRLTESKLWLHSTAVFWLSVFVLGIVMAFNFSLTVTADLIRNQVDFQSWEPYVWEFTSFVAIFVLYGMVAWLANRFQVFSANWLRNVLVHFPASVLFSLGHVLLMVLLRKAIYILAGGHYDFGDWSQELLYEYRKDLMSYFSFLLIYTLWQNWRTGNKSTTETIQKRLKVINKQGTHLILMSDISSIESGGNYVYLHANEQVVPMRGTMKSIMDELDSLSFIRVHRSYIINVHYISKLMDLSNDPCTLVLSSGKKVPVSRTYRPAVQAVIDQKLSVIEQ